MDGIGVFLLQWQPANRLQSNAERRKNAIKHQQRVNEKIRATSVRLVGADGEQIGIISLEEAMEHAEKAELDLVEVAPDSDPPVCKVMDYRRHMYEMKRLMKESRKKAKALELKELKLRPNIGKHDFDIKAKRAREFLEKGHKVKVTMRYRPREMRHYEIGTKVLKNLSEVMSEIAEVDMNFPKRHIARMQSIVLMPKKKSQT